MYTHTRCTSTLIHRIHAADVAHSLHCLLVRGGVLNTVWQSAPEDALLVALVSAAVHDFEHKGLNNDYLIKSSDQLAVRIRVNKSDEV